MLKEWLLKRAHWIAFGAAVLATVGDFGQLWVVNAGRPGLTLAAPPGFIIVPATLAGSLGIPIYGLGYYVRARQAFGRNPSHATWLALTGAGFGVLGGIVHAVTGISIATEIGDVTNGLNPMEGIMASGPIVVSLWALATTFFLAAGIAEVTLPQKHSDRLFNPLFLTLLFTLIASALSSPWNDFVGPAAVNIAHVFFFARRAIISRELA